MLLRDSFYFSCVDLTLTWRFNDRSIVCNKYARARIELEIRSIVGEKNHYPFHSLLSLFLGEGYDAQKNMTTLNSSNYSDCRIYVQFTWAPGSFVLPYVSTFFFKKYSRLKCLYESNLHYGITFLAEVYFLVRTVFHEKGFIVCAVCYFRFPWSRIS